MGVCRKRTVKQVRSPFTTDSYFRKLCRYQIWELTEVYRNLNTDFPLFSTLIVSLNANFSQQTKYFIAYGEKAFRDWNAKAKDQMPLAGTYKTWKAQYKGYFCLEEFVKEILILKITTRLKTISHLDHKTVTSSADDIIHEYNDY